MNSVAILLLAQTLSWRVIQPGVEFASMAGLHVVRIDPAQAQLTVALASEENVASKTAADWCRSSHLSVAINAGMFQNDQRSNVGYLRHGTHINNGRWNGFGSVLAFNARKAIWLDRDQSDASHQTTAYDVVVQNLRLITTHRRNVWSENNKQWSEAAMAIDSQGRLLFLFSRAPWSMRQFNALLLRLPLDVAGAMHLEGGPEASLSIHGGGVDLDLAGSFETGFWPDDSNRKQWPIPNVIGVVAKAP